MSSLIDMDGTYTSFAGEKLLVSGSLAEMLARTKQHLDEHEEANVLIFEDRTGKQIDFDFRGTVTDVLARAIPEKKTAGPGRPKLGVVCREISLLPRHWEWLEEQPGGASAALRRLVDEARKHEPEVQRARKARESASKFMWAMAGNRPGFEEASRALFANHRESFQSLIREWPADIRAHLERLTTDAFS